MRRNFIVDQEIDLNQNDFLKTKTYADNLTKIINNSESNKVFTIGLFGSWGTGKSSIVKTSEQDFDSKKVKFITYDAWQYVNDSFRRMFLRKLREDLQYEETDLMKRFYENESTDVKNKYQLSAGRLSLILGGLVLLIAILHFFSFEIEYKLSIVSIITLLGLLITVISGAFHQLKISVTKPHLFAPEQFEECFKEIVTHSLSKSNVTNNVAKWVKGDRSIQNLDKLVIVIDNIDRCSNEVAYNLLTDIKTFLSSFPLSIVFVIPVDDEALKNHLINTRGNLDCDREKEEFLRKFFNVTVRIKPYGESDMYSFAKQISEKNGLDFKPETINVASKEYAKNPRRVIQLFNNLLAEINYYYTDFVQKNETLICCLLIIREEYPKYYTQLVNSPKLFNEEYIEDKDEDKDVKRFIRIAQTATGKVSVFDISKILTNTHHQFENIAADIKDAIDTFDSDKVAKAWETDSNSLLNYICDRMNNAKRNELIDSDLVGYFDLIAQINTYHSFKASNAKRVDEKILDYLPTVISKTKNHLNLCTYALLRSEQKDNRIKTALIEETKRLQDQEKGTHWVDLFNAVLKVFTDSNTSQSLASTYTLYYESVEDIEFSKDQIEYLISNEFVQNRINDLNPNEEEEISLDVSTEEYKYVRWLLESKKNISTESYAVLFAKIIGNGDIEYRMRGKSIDEIAEILIFINPLLQLIPNRIFKTQLQSFYSLIVNDRKIPKPGYQGSPQYDSKKNFIDECIKGEQYLPEIKEFIFNIYRITNNHTSINNEIEKLIDHTYLDTELVKLINMRYSLAPILDVIFDAEDRFDNKDRLTVLEHCYNQKSSSGDYSIEEIKAEQKLNAMLTYAQQENDTEIFELLNSLSEQERYEKIISTLIVQKDSEFINSLPEHLLRLAINSFNDDNFREYADNFEFLSVIAQSGNIKQKSNLVKILIEKLDSYTDITSTFDIIAKMDNIHSFDEVGILHAHLTAFQKENKGTLTDEEKKTITRLKRRTKPVN